MVILDKPWEIMDITEKDIYIKWHNFAYQDDLESAESLIETHPRNAIVLGYYSILEVLNLRTFNTSPNSKSAKSMFEYLALLLYAQYR